MGYHSPALDKVIEAGRGNEERTKFFKSISRVHKNDHSEIRSVKHKIKELLHRELEEQKMLDLVSEQERAELLEQT